MTARAIKAINVPRMTRVTWYKHRTLMLAIPGMFLLAAALLVIDSLLQRHWISSHHFTYCLTYGDNSTSSRCLTQNAPYQLGIFAEFVNYWRTEGTVVAVFLLAAAAGLFAGVPWVAREFEGGGFRFTWTQSVSPRRWLLGTFGPLTLLPAATAAICGVAAHWWFQVAQFRLDGGTTPWGWESIEMTPLSMASWTLLAMALALLLGVTIRRVQPAMITFAVIFGGCLVLAQTWLSTFLFSVGDILLQLSYSTQEYPAGSYVVQTWFARPGGPKLNLMTVYAQLPNVPQPQQVRWLTQHHLTEWIAYQPHSHLVGRARPQRHPRPRSPSLPSSPRSGGSASTRPNEIRLSRASQSSRQSSLVSSTKQSRRHATAEGMYVGHCPGPPSPPACNRRGFPVLHAR